MLVSFFLFINAFLGFSSFLLCLVSLRFVSALSCFVSVVSRFVQFRFCLFRFVSCFTITRLNVRFRILLTRGEHTYDLSILLKGEILTHKTNLTRHIYLKCLSQAREVRGHLQSFKGIQTHRVMGITHIVFFIFFSPLSGLPQLLQCNAEQLYCKQRSACAG